MKGGITSGVVYPHAVVELARDYTFQRIGGASAGALAAAATAAAELGRANGGFDKLRTLSGWLGRGTALRDLFQAPPALRPLLKLLFAFVDNDKPQGLLGASAHVIRRFLFSSRAHELLFLALTVQVVVVGGFLSVLAVGLTNTALLFGALAVLGFGFAVRVAAGLWRGVAVLRRGDQSMFGLCPGTTQAGYTADGLTDWLGRELNDLAGLPPGGDPLTFGQLRAAGIQLELMATDLCHKTPHLFSPDLEQPLFLFDVREMARLFPASVVRWMVRRGGKSRAGRTIEAGPFYFLPAAADLPVVFAARISMSFPILFSAVPLHTISLEADRVILATPRPLTSADLHPNWFSDGGIVSSFPIHLFDDWLPEMPVFGINLSDLPNDAVVGNRVDRRYQSAVPSPGPGVVAAAHNDSDLVVYLPKADEQVPLDWRPVEGVVGLLRASFYAAKNHRDTTQSVLPSYRERVVTIRFRGEEGGLNLAMDEATIRRIQKKGERAGKLLRTQFDWKGHRWCRFLVVTSHLEEELLKVLDRYAQDPEYQQWLALDQPGLGDKWKHPRPIPWCRTGSNRLDWLRTLIVHVWHDQQQFVPRGNRSALQSLIRVLVAAKKRKNRPGPQGRLHFSHDPQPGPKVSKRFTPHDGR